eukprot:TRINITY_DN13398_c1_g2_i1.p1 TRINITY_DN13398_c1_g2~~TRINITY_DN13398_c1_g2_i1.p1  ORF type:complete len:418 (+),score=32.05 TRINITY_DN13398_c1_g2_i1:52-1254(+)
MASLAVRPKRFTADERCLGGRYMLQQQFQALRRRVLAATTQLDTLRPEATKIATEMRRNDCTRLTRLRKRPYWRRVKEAALPEQTLVDHSAPKAFHGIADMLINKGLRDRTKLKLRRRARPPPPYASVLAKCGRPAPREPTPIPPRCISAIPYLVQVDLDRGPDGATELGAAAALWRGERKTEVMRRCESLRRRRALRSSVSELLRLQQDSQNMRSEAAASDTESCGNNHNPTKRSGQPYIPQRPQTSMGLKSSSRDDTLHVLRPVPPIGRSTSHTVRRPATAVQTYLTDSISWRKPQPPAIPRPVSAPAGYVPTTTATPTPCPTPHPGSALLPWRPRMHPSQHPQQENLGSGLEGGGPEHTPHHTVRPLDACALADGQTGSPRSQSPPPQQWGPPADGC